MQSTHPESASLALGQVTLAEQPLMQVDLRTLKGQERELVKAAREATTAAAKALRKASR